MVAKVAAFSDETTLMIPTTLALDEIGQVPRFDQDDDED
jgi:hypothetical protein